MADAAPEKMRVDKWLWHARFFKSRGLAGELAGSGALRVTPTGGALGQVSERELAFLQDVWGSLNQAQTREQFVKSLDRVKEAVTASWERVYDAYADEYGEPHPDDPRVKDVSGQTTAPPQGNDPLGIL